MNRPHVAVRPRGFTYLGLMFLLVLLALGAAAAGPVWQVAAQRDRERELLFVGEQYRAAIEQYQLRSPPGSARFPARLEDLLRDPRVLVPVRHLRRAYADPFDLQPRGDTPGWGLIRSRDGAIVGVHSRSTRIPLLRTGFAPGLAFEAARSHRDWRFIAASAAALAVSDDTTGPPTDRATAATPEPRAPDPTAADEPTQPPQPPLPRTPRQADYRDRTPQACQRIAAYDLALCAQQAAQFGTVAERECLDSAVQRTAVCPFTGEPLPALFLRNQ